MHAMLRPLYVQEISCKFKYSIVIFAYLSLLVQEAHFAVIEVFFLIVGHTHTSIDQYFSVLARAIWKCHFLGSPLSLESLLANEHFDGSMSGPSWTNNETTEHKLKSSPLLVRKITVYYNMKQALLPLINPKLKYYPVPHQFRFELYHGICAMQYKLFSSQKTLLPLRPELTGGIYIIILFIISRTSCNHTPVLLFMIAFICRVY